MAISEFYIVAIKKETELYPFGGEGPVPYFYKSAELYAQVNLIYGIVFTIIILFGLWNWKTQKVNELIIVGIVALVIILWFVQGNI